MQTDIAQSIFDKVRILSTAEQEEVLEIVEDKLSASERTESRPIWEVITEISSRIPEEEWAKIPSEGTINVDHYLYGAPKKTR